MITGHDTFGVSEATPIKQALSSFTGEGDIRILLMQPGCNAMTNRAERIKHGSSEHYKEQAEKTIKFIKTLKKDQKIDIDYLTYPQRPIWKMFIIDNDLFLQSYPVGTHSDFSPLFHFTKKEDTGLYSAFCKIFQKKWDEGTEQKKREEKKISS